MTGDSIKIEAYSHLLEIFKGVTNFVPELRKNAICSLLIAAYAVTEPFHNYDPLWEFLKHCRNAAAHGGKFNLLHGEPRRNAVWGRFQIEPSMQGTPLVWNPGSNGLLSPGDPLKLLWDIEQSYSNIYIDS
jgi:hypothetical protein